MIEFVAVLAVLAVFALSVPMVEGLVRLSLWLSDRGPLPTAWIGDVESYVASQARS